MNFAVVAAGLNYDDRIGKRVVHSPYLFIFDGRRRRFEALANPLARKNEMQDKINFILLLRNRRVSHLLVQRCSEDLRILLEKFEIRVRQSVTGSIGDIVSRLQRPAEELTVSSSARKNSL